MPGPSFRRRRARGRFGVLLLLTTFAAAVALRAQEARLDEARIAGPAALLRTLPASAADVEPRLELAEARLAALQPTTQPADGTPADEDDLARYRAWEAYRAALLRDAALRAEIERLTADAAVREAEQVLQQVRQRTRAIRAQTIPEFVSEEDVREARIEAETLEARVRVLAERQAERSARLAGGFANQRRELEARLRELRTTYEALRQEPTTLPTTVPTTQVAVDPRRERLAIEIATAELGLQLVQLDEQRTEPLFKQDQRRLEALRAQLQGLTDHVAALAAAQGRDTIESLERAYAQTGDPVERALLELRLFVERVRLQRFGGGQPGGVADLQDLERVLRDVQDRRLRSESTWDAAMSDLSYRKGRALLELRSALQRELRQWRARLAELRARQDAFFERLQGLEIVRERAQARFEELAAELSDPLESPEMDPQRRREVEAEIAAQRVRLRDAAAAVIGALQPLADPLRTTIARVSAHVAKLDEIGQDLHWRRMTRRDAGVLKTDWPAALREARAVGLGLSARGAAAADSEEIPGPGLLDDVGDTRRQIAALRRQVRADVRDLNRATWIVGGGALLAAAALGLWLRRVARRRGVHLAEQIAEDVARVRSEEETGPLFGLSARLDLMGWNMLGDLGAAALVAGVLAVTGALCLDEVVVRDLLLAVLGMLVGAGLLIRFVHHLFEADSPPHRPIPCSDAVARHYRWWMVTLITFALVLGLPAALLAVAGLAPTLQLALLAMLKTGILVGLVLFLARRRRVLGQPVEVKGNWFSVLLRILYPVLFLAALALLVLQVIGYGALVTYVGVGVLVSLALLIVAGFGSEYVVDLAEHRLRFADDAGGAPARDGDGDEPPPYLLSLVRFTVRFVLLLGAVATFFWIWNIPWPAQWLNWRVIGLSVLTVLIAAVVDRVVVAALGTLHRSGRLPESTTTLVRRWTRGVILMLAGLTIIAIAGWKVDSLWNFLITLLAMIAIGFVAVWSILSNLLATLVILIWRPFNVGEKIEVLPEGLSGQVVDINFMYTVLKGDGDTRISIPNNLFAQKFIQRTPVRVRGPVRTLAEQLESATPLEG